MKRLFFIFILVIALLLPAAAAAASLQWDLDQTARDRTEGYVLYFTDGTTDYTKTFLKSETVVNTTDGVVRYENLEANCNLHPGIEYTFELTRYNSTEESAHSNSVAWTRPAYSPPTDQLPDPVSPAPSGVNGMGVE